MTKQSRGLNKTRAKADEIAVTQSRVAIKNGSKDINNNRVNKYADVTAGVQTGQHDVMPHVFEIGVEIDTSA